MRNCRGIGGFARGSFVIQMDPLPVFGSLRELRDTLWCNGEPFTHANFFSQELLQRIRRFYNDRRHTTLQEGNTPADSTIKPHYSECFCVRPFSHFRSSSFAI